MPVWHASIARLHPGRMVPIRVEHWDEKTRRKARRRLLELIDGVGTGEDFWEPGADACHLRRRLTDGELSLLDPAWRALPAIDGA